MVFNGVNNLRARQPGFKTGYVWLLKVLFYIAVIGAPGMGKAQLDTLDLDRLEPTYYYWDTCWYGYQVRAHPLYNLIEELGDTRLSFVLGRGMESYGAGDLIGEGKVEYARYIHSDSTLRILGVAFLYYKGYPGSAVDTDRTHCLPEYFILYRPDSTDEMIVVDSVRSDTAKARYTMLTTYKPQYNLSYSVSYDYDYDYDFDTLDTIIGYNPVYEAYFKNPVEMEGDFYLSGTTNNNYKIVWSVDSIYVPPAGEWWYQENTRWAHPPTGYITTRTYVWNGDDEINYLPVGPIKYRAHLVDEYNHGWLANDTLWHNYIWTKDDFNFFPIFDTSHYAPPIVTADTCPTPVALRVMNRVNDTVTLIWNGPHGVEYEVCVKECDTPNMIDTTCVVTTQFVTLMGFDTSKWYTVQVRTVCDSARYSEWSDSLLFFIPSPPHVNEEDSVLAVGKRMEELYTTMTPNPATSSVRFFSSFYITDLTFYTLEGREISRYEVGSSMIDVNVATLPRGVYIVRITTSRGSVFKKLILR